MTAIRDIDIIVPVRNEAANVVPLVQRIDTALKGKFLYRVIFIDDHSNDGTPERIESLTNKYPVSVYQKKGQAGKAFSILEGASHTRSEYIAFIDGDLQYPPEVIPEMIAKLDTYQVVVARRQKRNVSLLRQLTSRGFRYVFCKLLFGFHCDVQSGLKVFKRDILSHILMSDVTGWTLDLPLLTTATDLGYRIGEVNIHFHERESGESKVRLFQSICEIGGQALQRKFSLHKPPSIFPEEKTDMIGAGVVHKKRSYITHTTLTHDLSALSTFSPAQKILPLALIALVILSLVSSPILTLKILVGFMSVLYFSDVFFNMFVIGKSLHESPELTFTKEELSQIHDDHLPTYSILCPLYKEAHILPGFVKAIQRLDWPKEKLDCLLLLEADDADTIAAAQEMSLPAYIRIVVVPDSLPKTKPKACNYGLGKARGEYIVIYDAEDIPEPLQLKKAYLSFQKLPKNVACLQAKLNYFNPHQNLLTRFFTVEYSLWFDVVLTGLQSIETAIPLGGTSNHFRKADLVAMKGWDPFNVTEDCDLGIRLFQKGYRTAIIDSITLEEANSHFFNWLRQRSRWIKGYMQTYLIHMRHPVQLFQKQKFHALTFQLTVGGKIAFMLINPIMWVLTLLYFSMRAVVGPTIESLYPAVIFYMAAFSLVVGNFIFVYFYMIGAAKRSQWSLMKYVFLVPLYWLMVSAAAVIALYQLITKPHYWEKTNHGLNLSANKKKTRTVVPEKVVEPATTTPIATPKKPALALNSASFFVLSSLAAYGCNFLYNAYLGRQLSFSEFGVINLVGTFVYVAQIIFSSLTRAITYHGSFLFGKYQTVLKSYWIRNRVRVRLIALATSIAWLLYTPYLANVFHVDTVLPLLFFTPVWSLGIMASVDQGFLAGQLEFTWLGFLNIVEAIAKLAVAYALVRFGFSNLVLGALPLSMLVSLVGSTAYILRLPAKKIHIPKRLNDYFPSGFFVMSTLNRISSLAFISIDVIAAKVFLSPEESGRYALLSLVGKIVFSVGILLVNFITPLVGKAQGADENASNSLRVVFGCTVFASLSTALVVGPLGGVVLPILFGEKASSITALTSWYALGIACFTVASAIVTYYQAKKVYIFSVASFALAIVQGALLFQFHNTVTTIAAVMEIIGVWSLASTVLMYFCLPLLQRLERHCQDFFALFSSYAPPAPPPNKLKFLIFNWRDTKHAWAGGAEVYIQEIAKQWVKEGHRVTVFCGNDLQHPRNEVVDGVQIVRRGGFYSVYIWAFLYYVLRFRSIFDVIIDCENGVPFFTPLYVRKPVFLLIFHVHQKVFRKHLSFPLSAIASLAESSLMPLVYKNKPVITISQSSEKDIISLGLGKPGKIAVIHPGVEVEKTFVPETEYPSFLYLGRLKPYKNVDVALQAFARVHKTHPTARLVIAGTGESRKSLVSLSKDLGIENVVRFVGKVNDEQKFQLLSQSWAAVQPSSLEGWGITVIEANACGTPVIASNVRGLRDSILNHQTGVLVKERSVDDFAHEMNQLIENQQTRIAMSVAAKAWSKKFNWEDSAHAFYESVRAEISEAYVPVIS